MTMASPQGTPQGTPPSAKKRPFGTDLTNTPPNTPPNSAQKDGWITPKGKRVARSPSNSVLFGGRSGRTGSGSRKRNSRAQTPQPSGLHGAANQPIRLRVARTPEPRALENEIKRIEKRLEELPAEIEAKKKERNELYKRKDQEVNREVENQLNDEWAKAANDYISLCKEQDYLEKKLTKLKPQGSTSTPGPKLTHTDESFEAVTLRAYDAENRVKQLEREVKKAADFVCQDIFELNNDKADYFQQNAEQVVEIRFLKNELGRAMEEIAHLTENHRMLKTNDFLQAREKASYIFLLKKRVHDELLKAKERQDKFITSTQSVPSRKFAISRGPGFLNSTDFDPKNSQYQLKVLDFEGALDVLELTLNPDDTLRNPRLDEIAEREGSSFTSPLKGWQPHGPSPFSPGLSPIRPQPTNDGVKATIKALTEELEAKQIELDQTKVRTKELIQSLTELASEQAAGKDALKVELEAALSELQEKLEYASALEALLMNQDEALTVVRQEAQCAVTEIERNRAEIRKLTEENIELQEEIESVLFENDAVMLLARKIEQKLRLAYDRFNLIEDDITRVLNPLMAPAEALEGELEDQIEDAEVHEIRLLSAAKLKDRVAEFGNIIAELTAAMAEQEAEMLKLGEENAERAALICEIYNLVQSEDSPEDVVEKIQGLIADYQEDISVLEESIQESTFAANMSMTQGTPGKNDVIESLSAEVEKLEIERDALLRRVEVLQRALALEKEKVKTVEEEVIVIQETVKTVTTEARKVKTWRNGFAAMIALGMTWAVATLLLALRYVQVTQIQSQDLGGVFMDDYVVLV